MVDAEPSLVDKIQAVHESFAVARIGHAFGGALALAYYTLEPRATADIDVNVTLDASRARDTLSVLPTGVRWTEADVRRATDDEQIRLWWGRTPLDLFFRASTFHDGVADRAQAMPFAGNDLPFLSANDLAVFKALFDRPKDWLDISSMLEAGSLDLAWVGRTLTELLGADSRVERILALGARGV